MPAPLDYQREFARNVVLTVPDMLVPGRIPFGIWSHTAPAGGYKSAIAAQFESAIIDGTELPGLDWAFSQRGDVLVISPDESFTEIQTRELKITPFGQLDTDGDALDQLDLEHCTWHVRQPHGGDLEERIAWLWATIKDIEDQTGRKIVWIRWDTGAHLIGESDRNAYDHARPLQGLGQRMANEQRLLFLPQHLGKDGKTIGSVAIAAYSNCNTTTEISDQLDGKITATKVRGCAHWSAAITFADGLLEQLTDANPMVVGRSKEGSQTRKVLEFLAASPATVAEIQAGTQIPNAQIRNVIVRCRRAGEVEKIAGGQWRVVDNGWQAGPPPGVPIRWEENGKTFGVCDVCNQRMLVYEAGQTTHVSCEDSGPAEPPAPEPTPEPVREEQTELEETPEERNGFRMLKDSIEASRMKPIMRVPVEHRDQAPWNLLDRSARCAGEHRYRRYVDDSAVVRVLDRRGSYPSAMGSVPIVANLLTHTGALDVLPPKTGGIFQITRIDWLEYGIGHPFGRLADAGDGEETWWITTPHLKLALKLAAEGRIERPVILDSWTGRATDGLFTAFSKEVQAARQAAKDDPDAYTQVKRTSSTAIRCLYPDKARSPFWRPDWSVAVRAEASVRHWIRADQAVQAGATLVKLGAVDEAAFLVPDSVAVGSWVPSPYVVGDGYGQVSLKDLQTGEEWNAGGRR